MSSAPRVGLASPRKARELLDLSFLDVRCHLLERIDLGRLHRRYFFESGFLIQLGILRAVIQDVPIPARYGDEQSSLSI